ncbi:RuBisCO large subunit C-terminal-like domain-containing protein [Fodinibius sediminis]|uniref:Ribulose 1,5-bisphosphate carboxylase large subunit n=1 Tax=Fodinibius sediminis TaxID=1214077 RepID=A0A521DYB1_9BACT|nr:RuBisCO large subunit C-terminal-like domain-containing protein [Fodinibius sediminis]SMO76703.1 ribulose-1,5-bisphosphate carboxylase/oxygenase large subunit [Fodinibius sediminis]
MSIFTVTYQLALADGEELDKKIRNLCLEQSVELPEKVLSKAIAEKIVGRVRQTIKRSDAVYEAVIAWPLDNAGTEIAQFLNLLYGNISLKPGIKILSADWSSLADTLFVGPRFGIDGIRDRFHIFDRALSATALKPMGSSVSDLADLAFRFAVGGIDLIKDDHGIANQNYAPFVKRVEACVKAMDRAARQTGQRSRYFSNITADAGEVEYRYRKAYELGADGVMICPHITGLPVLHRLARLDIDLPIIAHPAFAGPLTMDESRGFTPDFLYGQLWRALGADFVIYPNAGGRFSYNLSECMAVNESARQPYSPFKTSFPMPGGGIKIENIGRWTRAYGKDSCLLVGSSLYEYPGGIEAAARQFTTQLKEINYES